jgi:uncharacterized protein
MRVILPPSETKRDGGDAERVLDLAALSFPQLTAHRRATLAALRRLSRNVAQSTTALGLSAGQRFEIDRNRAITGSPTMPAIERFTGVLFDGLEVGSLPGPARAWIGDHVVIHSALFGLIGADDPIPAYRLSHDSKLPELPLRRHWAADVSRVLEAETGLILDLRSESYANLGPLPPGENRWFLRVVSEGADGRKRALNHFNKKGKGEFVRALAVAGVEHRDVAALLAWAAAAGILLEPGRPGELELTV